VHGEEETRRAIAAGQALFGRSDLADVAERTLAAAVAEVPSAEVAWDSVFVDGEAASATAGAPPGTAADQSGGPRSIADLMAEVGIVASKSAARRAITEGGAYLNNQKVTDVGVVPRPEDLLHGRYLILRVGKRTVGAVEVASR
jgi:tyrosyl-tRNA synthetase